MLAGNWRIGGYALKQADRAGPGRLLGCNECCGRERAGGGHRSKIGPRETDLATAELPPARKKQQTEEEIEQGQQPDARPIAAGETDLRAIGRHITETFKDAAADTLTPQQVGVGVEGGISILIHGTRMLLEHMDQFVVIKLDMRNGYNEQCRAAALFRMA